MSLDKLMPSAEKVLKWDEKIKIGFNYIKTEITLVTEVDNYYNPEELQKMLLDKLDIQTMRNRSSSDGLIFKGHDKYGKDRFQYVLKVSPQKLELKVFEYNGADLKRTESLLNVVNGYLERKS